MDQEFIEIVKRNKEFFERINYLIRIQIEMAVPTRTAITNVLDNPQLWPTDLDAKARTAMIAFYEEVFKQPKRN